MKPLLLFILIGCSSNNLLAQKLPAWDYYNKEDETGSIIKVNTGFYEIGPIMQTPYLVKISHNYKPGNASGLPGKAEAASISRIQAITLSALSSKAECNMTGSCLKNKQCATYYYVSDTTGMRTVLQSLYKSKYKNYKWNIEIQPDNKWTGYFDYLYPNEKELQMIYYDRIVVRLLKLGDKLKKPHKVIHTAYFKNEDDMKSFITYLAKKKFTVLETTRQPLSKYRLKFYHITPITAKVIVNSAIELKKTTVRNSGTYDGWETLVALK